jgi:hypothetical protein
MANRSTDPRETNTYMDSAAFVVFQALAASVAAIEAAFTVFASAASLWAHAAGVTRMTIPGDACIVGAPALPRAELTVGGNIATHVRASSNPIEAFDPKTDSAGEGDGGAAGQVWTLPPLAGSQGAEFFLTKADAGILPVALAATGAELLDGAAAPISLTTQFDSIHVKAVGNNWVKLATHIAGVPA